MRIVTCVRQALDWNLSTKDFRIDPQSGAPVVAFARYRMDQFDEISVRVAVLAKQSSRLTVHAITAAEKASEDVLKHAIAMGADTATLIDTADVSEPDAPALLAATIRSLDEADVVLCGRTGSERGSASTGAIIAEILRRPLVANVVRLERINGSWLCQREKGGTYERVRVSGAFVATVTNAPCNVPHAPALKDKMRAHRQHVETVSASDVAQNAHYEPSGVAPSDVRRRFVPRLSRSCRHIQGEVRQQARAVAESIARVLELR